MYNKLFTKILDSSIWLAPDPHRLVWVTLIAAMDRDGVAEFACVENLAARARVSVDDTRAAIAAFESPDPFDNTQEFEGRRIEKIRGGWLVLNAEKYHHLGSKDVANQKSADRQRRYRERQKSETDPQQAKVTHALRPVTHVAPSESDHDQSRSKSKKKTGERGDGSASPPPSPLPADFDLTPERAAFASAGGHDPKKVFRKFVLDAKRHGRKFVDPDAAWQMWCERERPSESKTHRRASTTIELALREKPDGSDSEIAQLSGKSEDEVRQARSELARVH